MVSDLSFRFPSQQSQLQPNKLTDRQSTHVAFFLFLLARFVCTGYSEAFIKPTILGLVVYSAVLVYL